MTAERHRLSHTLQHIPTRIPSPLQELDDDRISRRGVRLFLKRDDLINPDVPGNKWRKLKYNLDAAAAGGHATLLTFGGAYSNHIRAVAAAGYQLGFHTIRVIRGEEHLSLNPALAFATSRGMVLDYLDRTTYREKTSSAVLHPLRERFGDFFLVPEGGSNAAGVRGTAELATVEKEHVRWMFHVYSGVAHGFAWPQLVPGTQSLPGHFISEFTTAASVAHLAADITLRRAGIN